MKKQIEGIGLILAGLYIQQIGMACGIGWGLIFLTAVSGVFVGVGLYFSEEVKK